MYKHKIAVREVTGVVYYIDTKGAAKGKPKGRMELISALTICMVSLLMCAAALPGKEAESTDSVSPCELSSSIAFVSESETKEVFLSIYDDDADEIVPEEVTDEVQLGAPDNCRLDRLEIDAQVYPPLKNGRVTSLYGYRTNPVTGKYAFHTGYDLGAKSGAGIYACLDGKVKSAKTSDGYGKYILLSHADGVQTLYAHCSKLLVKSGDKVKAGDKIALVGSTGNSTGPHLHIEFRRNSVRYDPEWLLGGLYG